MSENPASKVQEKNPEKETSIPEENISNSLNTEFEEEDIPKNIPQLKPFLAETLLCMDPSNWGFGVIPGWAPPLNFGKPPFFPSIIFFILGALAGFLNIYRVMRRLENQ